jgi:hypothetical protein
VGDQQSSISLLEQVLGNAGYSRVSSTMNSQEVCELHRINRYDLILPSRRASALPSIRGMAPAANN